MVLARLGQCDASNSVAIAFGGQSVGQTTVQEQMVWLPEDLDDSDAEEHGSHIAPLQQVQGPFMLAKIPEDDSSKGEDDEEEESIPVPIASAKNPIIFK